VHAPRRLERSFLHRAVLSTAALLVASAALAQPSSQGRELHGAMPMERQLAALDRLKLSAEATPPLHFDTGVWTLFVPRENPGSQAQVALGRKLYFDTRLSRDGTVACATCHDVSRGLTDRRPLSEGVGGKLGRRNAPTTMNAMFFTSQFLDGRSATLEEQARLPITNPVEMAMPSEAAALAAIAGDPEYQRMFQQAYGRAPSFDDLVRAIASFERTLVFLDAPFDRFVRGDATAIDADARAGFALFHGKGRCASCHHMSTANPIGTNQRFHNIGVSARHQNFEALAKQALQTLAEKGSSAEVIDTLALQTDLSELGRFTVTRNRADIGAFKTSQLRNVGITAPYMHDGSLATLWDVMDHYNKGGEVNPFLDGAIEPLGLTEREIDQLVAFMFALTDDRFAADNRAERDRQRAAARARRPFRDDALANRRTFPFETRLQEKRAQGAPREAPATGAGELR
jgi:cytochrome c peroxidase